MGLIADIHKDLEKGALQLMGEYRARLTVEAVKLCGDQAKAEDLVFRTIERALAKADTYKTDINLYAWMVAIMESIHKNDMKRPVVRGTMAVEADKLEEYAGADWSTDEEILRNSDSEAIRKALAGLDPKYHRALLLRYYQEFSVKEIANILQLPLGTVTRRLQIAHRILSGKLSAEFGRAKKPLAVLGAILLSATALFGAYQLAKVEERVKVEAVEEERRSGIPSASEQKDEPSASPAASISQGGAAVPAAQNEKAISNDSQENTTQQTLETQAQEKPTMKLAQTFAAAALAVTAAVVTVEADGITLESVSAKQRYPWNGLVDIDYTITYDNDATIDVDDNLEVLMVNHDVEPAVTNNANVFLQAPLPLTAGSHRITWDANADGVTSRIDKAEFIVEINHYAEAYMVIDVSAGSGANAIYPVDFLNGAPPNGFNTPEYKGGKIVLRRIHAGTYVAGSPEDEANRTKASEKQHRVALSQPFYIGVFEITQQQYLNVMGTNPSKNKGDDGVWQCRPVENVSWNTIRGGVWPDGKPGSGSFMDKLITKCRSKDPSTGEYTVKVEGFDLPTEFQWEYACRAGTTNAFNTTNNFNNASSPEQEAQLMLLGRYSGNASEGVGGISEKHTIVGSYLPNAWGLYDMHGNVWESCRDWFVDDPTTLNPKQYTDPVGDKTGGLRLKRGGSFGDSLSSCRSAFRWRGKPSSMEEYAGFRLSRTLP